MTPNKIKELRKKHRYSQRQLGEAIGAAQTTVAGWENGNRTISLDVLKKIADVLGEPIANLVDEQTQVIAEQEYRDRLDYIERGGKSVADYGGESALYSLALEDAQVTAKFKRMENVKAAVQRTTEQEMQKIDAEDMLEEICGLFRDCLSPQGRYKLFEYAHMLYESGHAERS